MTSAEISSVIMKLFVIIVLLKIIWDMGDHGR